MSDKKLTDKEIVNALECCLDVSPSTCKNCPLFNITNSTMVCSKIAAKFALDLIKRLQAENERLQNILICFMDALGKVRKVDDIDEISLIPLMSELNKQYRAELKAEAYKEFAERLKEQMYQSSDWSHGEHPFVVEESDIDNTLYELVGDSQ